MALSLTACAPSAEQRADLASVQSARISPAIYDKMAHHDSLSVSDLAAMAHAGVNEGVIVRYVRDNETIYFLNTADVEMLRKAGLSRSVIDFLLATPQAYGPAFYYGPPCDIGFGFGYGYYGYRGYGCHQWH
jgi:hypothetical protein